MIEKSGVFVTERAAFVWSGVLFALDVAFLRGNSAQAEHKPSTKKTVPTFVGTAFCTA
ncbi:hypothetical protein SBC1_11750 [Caballeronia sp. SBC1]|uniref:hypothetical protein n=1 Tax=unclassified Caballeronia TaxID=2646786 RepID=UPI0013E11A3D|nr:MULTISPECIES: hypothetical protein [unclassified Caballeronia]QIE23296.1 hypothetical protein SBC2_13160 [Caballeronia sp. SBC2]QIN61189.1 hypothetical protein SBC1_11750 [Caballeronia sp. SBC1]